MKTLIIGAEGFVGPWLAAQLNAEGYQVACTCLLDKDLVRIDSRFERYTLDITEFEDVVRVLNVVAPDVVFHLAAQSSAALSWMRPQLTMQVNIIGALNVLEGIRASERNTRLILIGSSEEYGAVSPDEVPINERQALRPGNPYAVSKITQGMLGVLYAESYGLDIVLVRAFNHIGPGQSDQFAISAFARRIATIERGGIDAVLKVGNLDAIRDFTDVRDIVRAYVMLARDGRRGETYNIGSGTGRSVGDVLQMLIHLSSEKISIVTDPEKLRPLDISVSVCDNAKIRLDTRWMPQISIEQTLQDLLDEWRNNLVNE